MFVQLKIGGKRMENKITVCDCDAIHAEIVSKVKLSMLEEETIYDLADFFKVFGDSTRLKMLWALNKSEMCVCDLAVVLNMTKSAVSHQLRALKELNLVKFRREGKNVFYSLADKHIQDIFEKGLEHIQEGGEANGK